MTVKKLSFAFMLTSLFAVLFLTTCSEDFIAPGGDSSAPTYSLSTNASPVNGGGIIRNPDRAIYETGTTVTLTAEPNAGYLFTGWTGVPSNVSATSPEITLTMNRDFAVIAHFEAIPAHVVTYNGNGNTGGAPPIDVNSPYASRSMSTVLGHGNLVRADHVFGGWNTEPDGSGTNYAADAVFNITGDVTFYARWIPNTVAAYSVIISGGGVGAAGSGRYTEGSIVEISAGTMAGQRFIGWTTASEGVVLADTDRVRTAFFMPANNVILTANFEAAPTYEVTVVSIARGATGGGNYAEGTTVSIHAGASLAGQRFLNWTATGGVTFANANTIRTTFVMPANDVTVTANFTRDGADPYYLGYGYDVIDGSYILERDVKRTHPVLNQSAMIRDNIIFSEAIAGVQEYQEFAGSSLREFYEMRNERTGISASASIPVKWILFSGSYSREWGVSTEQINTSVSSYIRGQTYRHTRREYIGDGNARPEVLKDYLTDGFIADLRSGDANLILNRYGTHVFVQYYKGGVMEFNYAYHGTELTTTTEMTSAMSASLKVSVPGINLGVGGSYDVSQEERVRAAHLESNSTFRSFYSGGIAVDLTSVAGIRNNYSTWITSIANHEDICGIAAFDDSFISVWALAEAFGEVELAHRLEEEFQARATRRAELFPQ